MVFSCDENREKQFIRKGLDICVAGCYGKDQTITEKGRSGPGGN